MNSITFPPRIQGFQAQDKSCPACNEIRQLIAVAEAQGDLKKMAMLRRLLAKHQTLTCSFTKRGNRG